MRKTGSGDKILDWGVVIAALILFTKTADVLSYFAPTNLNDIVGWDVSIVYGITCALLVEGVALALHFNHRARASGTAQAVKWTLLAISGMCQVFDGFIVTDTLAQLSPTLKGVFSYGVPLIPLLIMVMVFGIGKLPDLDDIGNVVADERPGFEGVLPMARRIVYGRQGTGLPEQGKLNDDPVALAKERSIFAVPNMGPKRHPRIMSARAAGAPPVSTRQETVQPVETEAVTASGNGAHPEANPTNGRS